MGEIALTLRDLRESSFVAGRFSSDEHLARMASRGSTRAFAVLYERHHQSLFRYCRSIVREPEDARDALQSTMMRAFAALRSGERDLAVRPWLFRIAHNESISILRRRRTDESIVPEEQPGGLDVEGAVEERERLGLLVADLQVLVERQRAALVMRELSGLSIEEIAGALSCSPGAAKQALFEARTALHEMSEGRAMGCEAIRQAISERDRRVLRGRKLRAHLRACAGCREFEASIGARRADLRALAPPLPPVAGLALLKGLLASGGRASKAVGTAAAGNHAASAGASGNGVGLVGTGASGAGVAGTGTGGATMLGGQLTGSLAAKALVGVAVVVSAATGVTHLAKETPHSKHPASSRSTSSPSGTGVVTGAQRASLAPLSLSPHAKVRAKSTGGALKAQSSRSSSLGLGLGFGHPRSAEKRGDQRSPPPAHAHTHGKGRATERPAGAGTPHGRAHGGKQASPKAGRAGKRAGAHGGARPGERSSGGNNADARAHGQAHLEGPTSTPSPSSSTAPAGNSERAGARADAQPGGQSSTVAGSLPPR